MLQPPLARNDARRRIARATLLAALIAVPIAVRAQPAQPRTRILIVFGHASNAPGVVRFADQLKKVVRERIPAAEIYEEFLDLDRFPDPARQPRLARGISEKYRGFRPDCIVVEGSRALRFTMDRLAGSFPDVPVVYGAVFEPIVDFSALPANVVGRRQPLPFAPTYALAHTLQPDAQNVVVIGGVSDSLIGDEARRQITPLLSGARLTLYQDWSYDELLDSLRRLSPRTFVILSEFTKDKSGRTFIPADLTGSLSRASSVPMFGIARNWIGDGIVGGSVADWSEDGMRVGKIVLRVLARMPNEPMPESEVAATGLVVDWRQLKRWGLPEDRLPPNTEVLFRPASLWERYRGAIVAAIGVFVVESMLIAVLLLERRRRVRAQRAVERQLAYERMISALTADMIRRSPGEPAAAIADALTRLGRFVDASAVVLVVAQDDATGPETSYAWTMREDSVREYADRASVPSVGGGERLDISLVAEHVPYGTLELYRERTPWPADTATRLGPVGDLIAGALHRAHASRVLGQTRQQVEHLARVTTLTGLSAAISHQLRQPLTAIRTNADAVALLLAQTPPQVDEARLAVQDIARDDERASRIIENFRAQFRKHDPISATVDLNALCQQIAQLVAREVSDRQARLILRLDPELAPVRGDPVQLQQALINLTLNALDALSEAAADREATISTATNNGGVEIRVSDTGPGLSPDVQRRLFEPFFSTKSHGTGMGLTIVRSIVERHRGLLRAENGSSGGALFTMTLPGTETERGGQPPWGSTNGPG
jgi:C4-dicarboxylate-specific signal transduction histidine kinase